MKRQNQLNIKRGLLSKLVLLVALFLGSSNAWAQKELPYSYGFENNNLATEGWTLLNPNTGTFATGISSSMARRSGSYYFRFFSNDNPPQTLISPLLKDYDSEIVVSFYYRVASKNFNQTFQVGYTSDTEDPANNMTWKDAVTGSITTYEQCEYTLPAHTRYIAIKCTTTTPSESISNNYYLCIDDFQVELNNPYKVPTDFVLSSYTANSATFSWTAGNGETAWKFAYSTDADFTPNTGTATRITDNPYTLTDLTEGTTYYASICADYGDNHYSDWTEKVAFTPRAEKDITINESSSTSGYGLFYSSSIGNYLIRSQVIIPSSSLSEINDRQITKLTFYSSTATSDLKGGKFEVYLKEVPVTSYSSATINDWGTCVYNSGTLSISSNKMEIELSTPFNYNGGNLQIGFKQTAKASSGPYIAWYYVSGIAKSNRQSTDDNDAIFYAYSPKVTITSIPISTDPVQMDDNGYTTYASPRALDLTTANLPSGLKAYKAEVDAENGKVIFTDINQKVAANTGILLAGTANETYNIPVADSGSAVEGGNDFLVNSTGGTFAAADGYTYFGFKKNSDPITFATFNPSTVAIPSNKAYLKVLTNDLPTEARQLVAVFDDGETTSLREIRNEELGIKNAVFFNLNGQRVAQPTKGLYIVNGKKVLVP